MVHRKRVQQRGWRPLGAGRSLQLVVQAGGWGGLELGWDVMGAWTS